MAAQLMGELLSSLAHGEVGPGGGTLILGVVPNVIKAVAG